MVQRQRDLAQNFFEQLGLEHFLKLLSVDKMVREFAVDRKMFESKERLNAV